MRALFVLAVLSLVACAEEAPERVRLTLFNSQTIGLPADPGIRQLRISASSESGATLSEVVAEASIGGGSASLGAIPYSEAAHISVEAINAAGVALYSGGTSRIVQREGSEEAYFVVYLTAIGAVEPLKSVFRGPEVTESPTAEARADAPTVDGPQQVPSRLRASCSAWSR